MDREIEWDENNICDLCDEFGAYDFYGDYICANCLEKNKNPMHSSDCICNTKNMRDCDCGLIYE